MVKVSHGACDGETPEWKPSSDRPADGGLQLDLDIRLKARGLAISRTQVVAVIATLAAVAWAAIQSH